MTDRNPQLATPETMAWLCEAFEQWDALFDSEERRVHWVKHVRPALDAYRRETRVPLRTRAEVDAEIAATVRTAIAAGATSGASHNAAGSKLQSDLRRLCAEPLSPTPAPCSCQVIRKWDCPEHGSAKTHGPRSVDAHGSSPDRAAAGATYPDGDPPGPCPPDCPDCLPDPEPCGCEETEALKEQLSEARKILAEIAVHARSLKDLAELELVP